MFIARARALLWLPMRGNRDTKLSKPRTHAYAALRKFYAHSVQLGGNANNDRECDSIADVDTHHTFTYIYTYIQSNTALTRVRLPLSG